MRRGPLKGNARRTLFTWSAPRMAPLVIVGRAARSALLSNIFSVGFLKEKLKGLVVNEKRTLCISGDIEWTKLPPSNFCSSSNFCGLIISKSLY